MRWNEVSFINCRHAKTRCPCAYASSDMALVVWGCRRSAVLLSSWLLDCRSIRTTHRRQTTKHSKTEIRVCNRHSILLPFKLRSSYATWKTSTRWPQLYLLGTCETRWCCPVLCSGSNLRTWEGRSKRWPRRPGSSSGTFPPQTPASKVTRKVLLHEIVTLVDSHFCMWS